MFDFYFQKSLSTPKIKNVQIDQEEFDNLHLLQTTLKEVCGKKDQFNEKKDSIMAKKNLVSTEKTHNLVVPPPPKTYVQLKQDWAYLQKDSKLLCQYLKVKFKFKFSFSLRNLIKIDLFSKFLANNYHQLYVILWIMIYLWIF